MLQSLEQRSKQNKSSPGSTYSWALNSSNTLRILDPVTELTSFLTCYKNVIENFQNSAIPSFHDTNKSHVNIEIRISLVLYAKFQTKYI